MGKIIEVNLVINGVGSHRERAREQGSGNQEDYALHRLLIFMLLVKKMTPENHQVTKYLIFYAVRNLLFKNFYFFASGRYL